MLSVSTVVAEDAMILLVAIFSVAVAMSAAADEGNVMYLLSAVAVEAEDDAEHVSAGVIFLVNAVVAEDAVMLKVATFVVATVASLTASF